VPTSAPPQPGSELVETLVVEVEAHGRDDIAELVAPLQETLGRRSAVGSLEVYALHDLLVVEVAGDLGVLGARDEVRAALTVIGVLHTTVRVYAVPSTCPAA
jgi:hypothetical protein